MSSRGELEPLRPAHVEVLAVLQAHEVECVLVGGVALQLHGASHTTLDVDVVVAVNPRNHARIEAALQDLNARAVATSERGTKFHTRCGELELLSTTSGVGGFDGWIAGAQRATVADNVTVLLAAIADVERNKNAAGRDKDSVHVELLTARGGRIKPGRMEQLMGPQPDAPGPGRRWEAVGAMVDRYCEQYGVELPEPPEQPPSAPAHLADWRRVVRMIDQVRAAQPATSAVDPETTAAVAVAATNQATRAPGAVTPPRAPAALRRPYTPRGPDARGPER